MKCFQYTHPTRPSPRICTALIATGLLLLAGACTVTDNNPTGAAYLDRTIPAVEPGDPYYVSDSEQIETESPSNAASLFLYAYTGETGENRTVSTILFPPMADSLALDSVKFVLHQSETNSEQGAFSVSIREWNQDWQDAVNAGEDFPDGLIPEVVTELGISEDSLGYNVYTVDLDPGRIQAWQDTAGFVLMIDEMDRNAYARFYSNQNTDDLKPRLDLYMEGDTTVTETVFPVSDTYYVRKPDPMRPDLLFLDNGAQDRFRLQFDLSGIAEDATINLARLILYADTTVSEPVPSEYFNVNVYRLTEAYTDTLAYASSGYSSGTLDSGESSVGIVVTSIVQGWTSGTYENFGFLFRGGSEGLTMDRRGFYVQIQDSTRMPRLEVYTTQSLNTRY